MCCSKVSWNTGHTMAGRSPCCERRLRIERRNRIEAAFFQVPSRLSRLAGEARSDRARVVDWVLQEGLGQRGPGVQGSARRSAVLRVDRRRREARGRQLLHAAVDTAEAVEQLEPPEHQAG